MQRHTKGEREGGDRKGGREKRYTEEERDKERTEFVICKAVCLLLKNSFLCIVITWWFGTYLNLSNLSTEKKNKAKNNKINVLLKLMEMPL